MDCWPFWAEGHLSAPTLILPPEGGGCPAPRGPNCKASLEDLGELSRSTAADSILQTTPSLATETVNTTWPHSYTHHQRQNHKILATMGVNRTQGSSHTPGSHPRQPLRPQAHLPQTPDEYTCGDMLVGTAPTSHTASACLCLHLHRSCYMEASGQTIPQSTFQTHLLRTALSTHVGTFPSQFWLLT